MRRIAVQSLVLLVLVSVGSAVVRAQSKTVTVLQQRLVACEASRDAAAAQATEAARTGGAPLRDSHPPQRRQDLLSRNAMRLRQRLALAIIDEAGTADERLLEVLEPVVAKMPLGLTAGATVQIDERLVKALTKPPVRFPVLTARLLRAHACWLAGAGADDRALAALAKALPAVRERLLDFDAELLHLAAADVHDAAGQVEAAHRDLTAAWAHGQRVSCRVSLLFFSFGDIINPIKRKYASYVTRHGLWRPHHRASLSSWFGVAAGHETFGPPATKADVEYSKAFPVHSALSSGNHMPEEEAVLEGLTAADFTKRDESGALPLHKAAESGNEANVVLALKHSPPNSLAAVDDCGQSPLLLALRTLVRTSFEGSVDGPATESAVLALLKAGAPVDTVDVWGDTPLHLAARAGCEDAFFILLGRLTGERKLLSVAARSKAARAAGFERTNVVGRTALHEAAAGGNPVVLLELLELGADPNRRCLLGATALHLAARNGNADCVKVLLERGADTAVRDEAGLTARDWARIMRTAEAFGGEGGADAAVSDGPRDAQRTKFSIPFLQIAESDRSSPKSGQYDLVLDVLAPR